MRQLPSEMLDDLHDLREAFGTRATYLELGGAVALGEPRGGVGVEPVPIRPELMP